MLDICFVRISNRRACPDDLTRFKGIIFFVEKVTIVKTESVVEGGTKVGNSSACLSQV